MAAWKVGETHELPPASVRGNFSEVAPALRDPCMAFLVLLLTSFILLTSFHLKTSSVLTNTASLVINNYVKGSKRWEGLYVQN